DLIRNRLENRGFFYNQVSSEIYRKNKLAWVDYRAATSEPYSLDTLIVERDSLPIDREIILSQKKTLIKKGRRFDLQRFKDERERLDSILKLKGYYNFNADYLIFEADTNDTDSLRNFRLYLRLKKNAPQTSLVPYVVDKIDVFPNYSIDEEETDTDTVQYNDKNFIQKGTVFKEELLDQYILIEKGKRYDPVASKLSSNRLSSIGNYKFVNLRYEELKMFDSTGHLRAQFQLSPMTKRTLRTELMGVSKSNSFAGPALTVAYRNRNLFQGGEMLNVTATAGYEFQVGGGDRTGLQSFTLGLTGDLIFPRMLFVVPVHDRFSYSVPKTKTGLGVEYLSRGGLYRLNSFFANFGYIWNANKYAYHEFNPISINLVNLTKTTPEFDEILDSNPFLKKSFEQNYILHLYVLLFCKFFHGRFRSHDYLLSFCFYFIENSDNDIDHLFGSADKKIIGLEYAQFGKIDIDLQYHL